MVHHTSPCLVVQVDCLLPSVTPNSKCGTQATASMAVAAAQTLILPSDAQRVSETDSGYQEY